MPIRRVPVQFEPKTPVVAAVEFDLDVEPYLLNGGVAPRLHDSVQKVRPSSVLGQLRFFWRLLQDPAADPGSLRAAEVSIFGGPSTAAAFSIDISVTSPGNDAPVPAIGTPGGYLLFSARPTDQDAAAKLSRGVKFLVRLAGVGTPSLPEDLLPAVKLWTLLGGVGSRTRRGVGAVQLRGAEAPKSVDDLKQRLKEIIGSKANGIRGVWVGREFSADGGTSASLNCFHEIDKWYRKYRQDRNGAYGRSHWDEPDEIRRLKGHSAKHPPRASKGKHPAGWARGVMGLPIVFKFKDDDVRDGDPPTTVLEPDGTSTRMASPLLFRPVKLSTGKAVPVVLLLNAALAAIRYELKEGSAIVASGLQPPTNADDVLGALLPDLTRVPLFSASLGLTRIE